MTKQKIAAAGVIMLLLLSGCGSENLSGIEENTSASKETEAEKWESVQSDEEDIAALYRDIYEKAGTSDTLEIMRKCIKGLGDKGYAAVDEKNQIDLTDPEQVLRFCKAVEEKAEDTLQLIVVSDSGGFIKYDFHTMDGMVEVSRAYYQYTEGKTELISTAGYRADVWQYTEEGYLLFAGKYDDESYQVLLSGDVSEHVAVRVEPLAETCREMTRRYVWPVGYGKNNLFLVDWDEAAYGELDFYDLFDKFYPRVYSRAVPYTADDNLNVGTVYQVPADTFETVIDRYFRIDSAVLRQKTDGLKEEETYEYRPRGFYENDYGDIPYPEVVDYTVNSDGTITLEVNAVYPEEDTARAFTHKTVVRDCTDGSFQYVSNQVVYPREGYDSWWHCDRLTRKQWEETYKAKEEELSYEAGKENAGDGSLLSETEKEALQDKALTAAKQAEEVYQGAAIEEDIIYGHIVRDFSREQRNTVVSLLGEAGYTSVTDDANMENPDGLRDFYQSYLEKRDAMTTVFDVRLNGSIGACTFLYRSGRLQTYYVEIAWKEGGIPEIISATDNELEKIRLTEKGYFLYAYKNIPYHSSLCQYFRVSSLSDSCRELTEKYINGLSYVNYNMLVTNWDEENVQDILMPCMFEDIYRIATGEEVQPKKGEIPAEIYEKIMTTYFPVTRQQIRETCGYHADTDSYPYEMIFARQYPPFGEVVDYQENPDSTITLWVDGVWPDYDSDCAFTNKIIIEPFADGSFRYLSNSIEKRELDIPVVSPAVSQD